MGIKNLSTVLKNKNSFEKIEVKSLQHSIIAVDFSLFLYRFIYNQNDPIECFIKQLTLFFRNNILPVYVLDGTAPTEKKNVIDKRISKRFKIKDELNKIIELRKNIINTLPNSINNIGFLDKEINRLEKKCVYFSKENIDNVLELFNLCGVPVIQENYESDWILAKLSENNIVDYVLSEDSDLLTFGTKKLLKNFSLTEETAIVYDMDNILKNLNINNDQFVDMCILCGCDYAPKIKTINCNKSYELIQKNYNIENIINNENININLEITNNVREIFNKKMNEELIKEISKKIIKKHFQFEQIKNFINNNQKKYLTTSFLKSCQSFSHHKQEKISVLQNFFLKNLNK